MPFKPLWIPEDDAPVSRRKAAPQRPYRGVTPPTAPSRYRVLADGEPVEGETFGEVIRRLRELGFTTEQVVRAAVDVMTAPVGEVVALTRDRGEVAQ